MSCLIGAFERDIVFLKQNLVPQSSSGNPIKDLNYSGTEHEKLQGKRERVNVVDNDVKALCEALEANSEFTGPLNLYNNSLTDLVRVGVMKVSVVHIEAHLD